MGRWIEGEEKEEEEEEEEKEEGGYVQGCGRRGQRRR